MIIKNIPIGAGYKPFIIAEMSGNHNQSLERALTIVDAAAGCSVQAIKLQTYTPDTMTIKGVNVIEDDKSLWNGKELYDLYSEAYTPWEWHQAIFNRAEELGLIAFSTPFDETAVDFLESLNVPAYKVASFENTDWPLLRKIAQTGKPVIMSTGAATIAQLDEAVKVLRDNGCTELVLLKCTSSYPATPESTNLMTIPHMRELFDCEVGLSDHTMGTGVSVASVALGVRVIEKHFTLSRADGGVDSAFSMEPDELKALVVESERAYQALGKVSYGVQKSEEKNLLYKRSIYFSKDLYKGDVITSENIRIIRPGLGLPTKFYDLVLGKTVKIDTQAGSPMQWEHIL